MVELQAVQTAWSKLDSRVAACMDSALSSSNSVRVADLVRGGVLPNDPRLSEVRSSCERQLKYPSSVDASGGFNDFGTSAANATADDPEARADLEALRDKVLQFSTLPDPAVSDARAQLMSEIDGALIGPVSRAEVDRMEGLFSELSAASVREAAWSSVKSQVVGLQQRVDAEKIDDLPADLTARRLKIDADLEAELIDQPQPRQTYGLSALPCDNVQDAFATVLCNADQTRWIILDYVRADFLLLALRPDEADSLNNDAVAFRNRIAAICKLASAAQPGANKEAALACLRNAYQSERDRLAAQVRAAGNAGAIEELQRPIQQHMQLQGLLRERGYLGVSEQIDGAYGPNTRAAISRLQATMHLTITGIMSDQTAKRLMDMQLPALHSQPQIDSLSQTAQSYSALIADIDAARRVAELTSERADHLARVHKLLVGYLPADLRSFLEQYADAMSKNDIDQETIARYETQYAAKQDEIATVDQVSDLLTASNRWLVADDGGYAILYNVTPNARGVTKTLDGELSFDNNRLRACTVFSDAPNLVTRGIIRKKLAAIGASLRLPLAPCDESRLASYDLLIVQAGSGELEKVVPVLTASKAGEFQLAGALAKSDIEDQLAYRNSKLDQIKSLISAGATDGYGFLGLSNNSANVCAITAGGLDAHRSILQTSLDAVRDELDQSPFYTATNADEAFVEAKRDNCGAIYASAADLKKLMAGFDRDTVDYHVWPIWIDATQLAASTASWKNQQSADARKWIEQAHMTADEQALANAKAADHEVVRKKQEDALRAEHGSAATALQSRLGDELSAFLQSDDPSSTFAMNYPSLADGYRKLIADNWELVKSQTDLQDYGVAIFKKRQLALVVGRSTIRMRNRLLGEYQDLCFLTAFVDDAEFAMERDTIGLDCNDALALQKYELGEQFQSQWVVQ